MNEPCEAGEFRSDIFQADEGWNGRGWYLSFNGDHDNAFFLARYLEEALCAVNRLNDNRLKMGLPMISVP